MSKVIGILSEIRPEFDFTSSDDFMRDGLLDSFDMVRLVTELDATFGLSIDGIDILPENFRNLKAINDLLKKYGVSA